MKKEDVVLVTCAIVFAIAVIGPMSLTLWKSALRY